MFFSDDKTKAMMLCLSAVLTYTAIKNSVWGSTCKSGMFTRYRHDFHTEMNRKLVPRLHKTASIMQSTDLSGNK